jgi:hypothetical protein
MDIKSFLFGALLAGVGLFFTGFLRKAGEELYAWAKKRIYPKADELPSHHLTLHINGNNLSNNALDNFGEVKDYPLIERISRVSIDEIRAAIDAAPPLQRDQIASNYIGLQIEWDTIFISGDVRNDKIRLYLKPAGDKYSITNIWCEVLADEYLELRTLQEKTKIRLSGEIEKIYGLSIEIKDARLQIL